MSILNMIFGDANEKELKLIQPLVEQINALEPEISALDQAGLQEKVRAWQAELRDVPVAELEGRFDNILPEVYACVREAANRVLGQRHYDVQLIGGIVLHQGKIAEMKTGEGKTLVATLPLFLNALAGRGAHLVTVNDYLARVGAGWMAPVYHYLGLSTGVIIHESGLVYDPEYTDDNQYDVRLSHFRPVERQQAYGADITYGTNNEYGFDYLRDNMAPDFNRMVQRGLFYAIVDEIDSILIDEARTPLIISAPAEESTDKYYQFADLVRRLNENVDYNVDEKMRAATLTDAGISKMEKWLNVDNIYTERGIREVHHIEQALKAHAIFKRDKDYVVQNGEVIIVDEFTGRLMHGRRYSEGLHQAIEAKEGVQIQRESQTLATITFQNFFRMYDKLSGMTGTAVTEAEEFSKIYELDTVIIPTNRPCVRQDLNDLIYKSEEAKFLAVINEVKECHAKGQPVLVGTISIEKNEVLSNLMERNGLRPNVLNAKNHEKEARFIAEAGKAGSITIATNMAGRGVDIMLGGDKPAKDTAEYAEWTKEHEAVLAAGGLHVIGTERHESRRIDNQLRGRAGRQGDPGSSRFYVSVEDDLMRIFGGDRMKSIMTTLNMPDDMPIENRLINRSLESAQKKVEGNNFDIRKHLVEYDDVINKHREAIYGKRREILSVYAEQKKTAGQLVEGQKTLRGIIMDMLEQEIEQVVSFHTAAEDLRQWNLAEISEVAGTIFPVEGGLKERLEGLTRSENGKLDKARARTLVIEYLSEQAEQAYGRVEERARELNVNWLEMEKGVLVRSIDTLWVEHLEAMASVRQGIGLRGYGQRDPLIEYKKEAYRLFNEVNSLIQKEIVYSIFKVAKNLEGLSAFSAPGLMERARKFSAPAKEMGGSGQEGDIVEQKAKNADGSKVGRNDPCPCGSGKKYKKCHGG